MSWCTNWTYEQKTCGVSSKLVKGFLLRTYNRLVVRKKRKGEKKIAVGTWRKRDITETDKPKMKNWNRKVGIGNNKEKTENVEIWKLEERKINLRKRKNW
jgi:hypothetical protein